MRYVITGANRGIGLELARQAAAAGHEVIATARDVAKARELAASKVSVLACDVGSAESVRAFAAQIEGPIDVLINNAGVLDGYDGFEQTDLERALDVYNVNAVGALRVTQALLGHVRRGGAKKLVHITSGMGSITDNGSGGAYAYRMSKAALNMASRSLAADLRAEGIVSVAINPGWVKTDMGGPSAQTSVTESAQGILARIDELTLADSGEFLDFKAGKRWPF